MESADRVCEKKAHATRRCGRRLRFGCRGGTDEARKMRSIKRIAGRCHEHEAP